MSNEFTELVEKIMLALRLKKFKDTTMNQYHFMVQKIIREHQLSDRELRKHLKKDLLPITRIYLVNYLNSVTAYSHNSILYFIKGLHKLGFIKDEVIEGITKVKPKHKRISTKKELLSRDEIKLLIDNARDSRDKAIINSMFDVYPRITEWLTIERKHVSLQTDEITVSISISKSETRTVTLIESYASVKNWLLVRGDEPGLFWFHPNNQDIPYRFKKQSQLTLKERKSITQSFRNRLKTVQKRAGLQEKRIYPHLLRHSGHTDKKRIYSENTCRQTGGWVKGSKSQGEYDHLDNTDARQEMRAHFGRVDKAKQEVILKKCFGCGTDNPTYSTRCSVCGRILNLIRDHNTKEYNYIQIMELPYVKEAILKGWRELEKKKEEEKEE